QPPVLIFQLPQPLRLSYRHPAILRLPRIHRVLRHSQLTPHLRCAAPRPICFNAPIISTSLYFLFVMPAPSSLLPDPKIISPCARKMGEGQTHSRLISCSEKCTPRVP